MLEIFFFSPSGMNLKKADPVYFFENMVAVMEHLRERLEFCKLAIPHSKNSEPVIFQVGEKMMFIDKLLLISKWARVPFKFMI